MFVIPCYETGKRFAVQLSKDILKYHNNPEILVIDSDSPDKSYFKELESLGVKVANIKNKNYHVGAYWHAFHNYERDFYYMIHDSCRIKANLDYIKDHDLIIHGYFYMDLGSLAAGCDIAQDAIKELTSYDIIEPCYCVAGPIFFCKRRILEKLSDKGFDKILPNYSAYNSPPNGERPIAGYALEGAIGQAFTQEGFKLDKISLIGDVHKNGPVWKTGADTSWQFPIEKFFVKRP